MNVPAEMDQAVEEARETARPIAAFYNRLIDEDMEKDCAKQIVMLYAKYLLFRELRG